MISYSQLTMDHPFEGGEVPNISKAVNESGEEEACSGKLNIVEPQNTAGLWVPDTFFSVRRSRTSNGYSKHGCMQWLEYILRPSSPTKMQQSEQ
ncbi:hypothetical protein ACLOJK_026872 [Asimina triloba]